MSEVEGNTPIAERTRREPERLLYTGDIPFEQRFHHNRLGETARVERDGRHTQIHCYELIINMQHNDKRAEAVSHFLLAAAQAGYREAIGPIVFPPGEKDGVFGSIFFTLEKPQAQQTITQQFSQ